MRHLLLAATAILVALSAAPAGARLYTDGYGNFSVRVEADSDYRNKGVSRSDNEPSAQINLDWERKGAYAGVHGRTLDFGDHDEGHYEVSPYAGYKFPILQDKGSINVGVEGYLYPAEISGEHYQYVEGKIIASYKFQPATVKAGFRWSPNYYDDVGVSYYPFLEFAAPIGSTGVTATGSAGHLSTEKNPEIPDYTDWSLGLEYIWNEIRFGAKYVDTNVSHAACDGTHHCQAAGIVSVSRRF